MKLLKGHRHEIPADRKVFWVKKWNYYVGDVLLGNIVKVVPPANPGKTPKFCYRFNLNIRIDGFNAYWKSVAKDGTGYVSEDYESYEDARKGLIKAYKRALNYLCTAVDI